MDIYEYLDEIKFPAHILRDLTRKLNGVEYKDVPENVFQEAGFFDQIGWYKVRVNREYGLVLKYSYVNPVTPPAELILPTLFLTQPVKTWPEDYHYYQDVWVIQPFVYESAEFETGRNIGFVEFQSNIETELRRKLSGTDSNFFDVKYNNVCVWNGQPVLLDW